MTRISGAEMERRVDELIRYCDDSGEPPTSFVMRKILGMPESELEALREGRLGKKVREEVLRLDDYRTYFWTRKGISDSKLATFSTFNLKLLMGGEEDKDIRVNVRMEGVGDDAFG